MTTLTCDKCGRAITAELKNRVVFERATFSISVDVCDPCFVDVAHAIGPSVSLASLPAIPDAKDAS